ncbi:MAG: hybrid sensor histidine kinase/response regulator [Planctomycetota bacterium]
MADLFRLGEEVRGVCRDVESLEGAAQHVVSLLHQRLVDDDGRPACALVRFFSTLPFDCLEPELQSVAASSGVAPLDPSTRCLTLLATAGQRSEWNDRRRSVSHRAIPLTSEAGIRSTPMISQLLSQLGLDVSMVVQPDPSLLLEEARRTYNVFFVPEAVGSPFIPSQDEFVIPCGVRSVLGFGGMLPTGDVFSILLFSRVRVLRSTADAFRTLALSVKLAVMPASQGPIFAGGEVPASRPRPDSGSRIPAPAVHLQSQVAALQELLHAQARTVTEQASLLEEAVDRALAAGRAKEAFLATMSHEIRTPLNSVIGMSEVLVTTTLDTAQRRCAEAIRTGGVHLNELLEEILRYSRLKAGGVVLECRPFGLRGCVADAIELAMPGPGAQELSIGFEVEDAVPDGWAGDEGRLRRILINLVSNAVKFAPGGEVRVEVAGKPMTEDGCWELHIAVRDTGVGIPLARIQNLFEPFVQADASTTRTHGGAGLGLAISRRLCELMGGGLRCESEEGVGTTFHAVVVLRRAEPEAAGPPASRETPASSIAAPASTAGAVSGGLRLLVVDDNQLNRLVATTMLTKLGYTADVASSGPEAIALLEKQPCDGVFMDVHMPQMDGYETTRRILERLPDRPPWIVAMTAMVLPGDEDHCLRAGMNSYLAKPYSLEQLAVKLEEVVAHVRDRVPQKTTPSGGRP